jgi:WD40 repeat protein
LHEFGGHINYFNGWYAMSFSPDGALLATTDYDIRVRIWNVSTGAQQQNLPGYIGPYSHVVFSPDGKRVLTTVEGTKIN